MGQERGESIDPMLQPTYIISVFQAGGLCSGAFDHQQTAARLQSQLESFGLRLMSWEPVSQSECFAVLVWAQAQGGSVDLLEVRRRLAESHQPLGLQIRIQREDVFSAMHRL